MKDCLYQAIDLEVFEKGKVGPKDGDDFIGGNYVSAINISSTVPQFFTKFRKFRCISFFDAAIYRGSRLRLIIKWIW